MSQKYGHCALSPCDRIYGHSGQHRTLPEGRILGNYLPDRGEPDEPLMVPDLAKRVFVLYDPDDFEFCDLHRNPEPCKRCEAMDRRREEQKDER